MKKIHYILTITVFSIYWGFTLIFVAPDNYISISLLDYSELFNTFLYQKWGFFAPPPKSNDRLYYNFTSKKDSLSSYTFEVMQPITSIKTKKAPFNSKEDILDYVLSNTINTINDGLVHINQTTDFEEEVEKNKVSFSDKIERGKKYVQTTASYKTIQKYAYFVAKKNNLDAADFFIDIQITKLDLPKFADRYKLYSDNREQIEKIIFQSDKFELNERNYN